MEKDNCWIDVAKLDDFKPNTLRIVNFDDIQVIVINRDDDFYAIEDICTHDGGTLSDGDIEQCEIICPRHGARFDIRTGEVTAPPAYEPIKTFPVRIQNGIVQVCDDRFN